MGLGPENQALRGVCLIACQIIVMIARCLLSAAGIDDQIVITMHLRTIFYEDAG